MDCEFLLMLFRCHTRIVAFFLIFSFASFFPCFFYSLFASLSPTLRRREGALEGIAVAAFVGVVSGFYIYQPLFIEMNANRQRREREEAAAAATASKV